MINPKVPLTLPIAAAILFALSLTACPSTSAKPGPDPDPVVTEKNLVLEQLQIDTTPGARLKKDGTAMTEADNPLGKEVTNLQKIDEIFVVSGDNSVQLLNQSSSGSYEALSVASSELAQSSGLIKRPVAADMDGDGKQEIVTAVFAPIAGTISFYRIADGSSYSMTNMTPTPITWNKSRTYTDMNDITSYSSDLGKTRIWNHTIDIAAADLDDDGMDEIALTSEGRLYILDHDFSLMATEDFSAVSGSNAESQILRVECGDLDEDGKAEIIVSNGTCDAYKTAQISILRMGSGTALATILDGRPASAASTNLRSAEIAIGDVDGDGRPEAVFAGLKDDAGTCATIVMDISVSGGVLLDSFLNVIKTDDLNSGVQAYWGLNGEWMGARDMDAMIPILTLADLDGDGTDEIVANDDILQLTYTAASSTYSLDYAFGASSDETLRSGLVTVNIPGWGNIWGYRAPDTAYFNQAKAGDLNGDGKEEIVVLDYLRGKLRQYGYNPNSDSVEKGADITITGAQSPYLCLADVDGDGAVVRYKGHSVAFSAPIVIGVISSPPYWDKTDASGNPIQDTGDMGTVFGVTAGAEVEAGATVGFSVGATIGEKLRVPVISNGEESVKLTVTQRYSASFDVAVSGEIELSYGVPPGEDKVIFTSVPIDVYAYEDVSTGEEFFIREQRKPEAQFVDVDFYNANNGAYPDIDAAVLNHEVGKPFTYPTLANITSVFDFVPGSAFLFKQIQDAGSLIFPGVPQGDGTTTVKLTAGGSLGAGFECETEVTLEEEASFAVLEGASFSASVGFHVSAKVSASTFVEGTVGGLATPYYTDAYRYKWGLYAYPHTFPGNAFMVLNYWVDPVD